MATESTAIVNLVDLVKKNRPMPKDAGDDMLFGGHARFDAMAMPLQAAPVTLPPLPAPFVRQPTPILEKTIRVPRSADPQAVKKFFLPVGLFVVAMVLLSIYLAKGDKKAPKAAVVHMPEPTVQMPVAAPAPTPVVAPVNPEPVVAAKAEPTVTPIDSPPTIAAAAEARPTVSAAAEPTVPTVPEATEAQTAPTVAAVTAAAPAKTARKHHHEHHRAAKRTTAETRVATAEAPKPAALEKLGGKAALVVSSSPAREVWIDGRNTKQMTPQRLTLVAGTHNVTLFDKKTRSAKTFQVELKPNQTLKIAKSY